MLDFGGMFSFLDPTFVRVEIGRTEFDGNTIIDTCSVNDGEKPFETGIQCPKYNHGEWVIVENYDTEEDARKGHNKWVAIMASDNQPEKLVDCNNSEIARAGKETFGNNWDDEFPAEF